MFAPHPSRRLQELFAHKPYQGAPPHEADFLFVGLDANYDADIEDQPIFSKVCEYHEDGVRFWQRHGVHHPFLLPGYSGKGRPYHVYFAKIGFTSCHATDVSFVELLPVPTVESNLHPDDLDRARVESLDELIREGPARHVFVSSRVKDLMGRCGARWLRAEPLRSVGSLGVLLETGEKKVYLHYHFSAAFHQTRKHEQIAAIRALVASRGGT
jgi:hypothetical protein